MEFDEGVFLSSAYPRFAAKTCGAGLRELASGFPPGAVPLGSLS